MKKLYILRHAKSGYPEGVEDHDRPLNKKGEHACLLMGRYFREHSVRPDVILSSDAVRTTQTINNILREAGLAIEPQFLSKLYLATPGEMLKEIAKVDGSEQSVMVVCHNPGAAMLTTILAKSGERDDIERLNKKYPTAGMACLSLDTDSWAQLDPRCGYLDAFVTPERLNRGVL